MSHILLIDDDEDILFSMSILLKRKGFAVTTTKDAHRIKYLVDMYKTDLIIMDINILEYDGRYICFDLKLNHDLKIPIILFSASQNSLETVKDYLADDFIAKPFSIDHVVTTINRHLINTELQITKLPL